MEDIVLSAAHPTVKKVPSVLAAGYEWSFVVPEVTVTAMQAAIQEFRFKQHQIRANLQSAPVLLNFVQTEPESDTDAVVTLRAKLVPFSRCYHKGERWLNDAVLAYGIEAICEGNKDVLLLSSHALKMSFPEPPKKKLFAMKFVVLPINHANMHWTVIIVEVGALGVLSVHYYDPLCSDNYKRKMIKIWDEKFLPFLQKWHEDRLDTDGPDYPFPGIVHPHKMSRPKQPDGGSCGMMVMGMVFTYVRTDGRGFELDNVTTDYIKAMRLRLLWLILCGSLIHPIGADDERDAVATGTELASVFVKGSAKVRN
ncbi:hypothetical protein BBJ28_00022563 [Nothophytophthora sp. Chile5]|nr:hypothetical protein BBJ28_00022563 [Nothophytophthora sp. Chile5]